MSTEEILEALCHNGTLVRWKADLDKDEVAVRRVYLDPDVYAWLTPPDDADAETISYAADVCRFLKGFVIGNNFNKVEKLKNLDVDEFDDPDEGVWAMRIQREPKTRIFGGFPTENVFIGLNQYLRAALPKTKWVEEKGKVHTKWAGKFKVLDKSSGKDKIVSLPRLRFKTRAELTSNRKGRVK